MDSNTLAVVGVAAGIVIFGGSIWLIFRRKKKIRQAWVSFAANHGLEFRAGPFPSVAGSIDGRSVEVGSRMGTRASGRRDPHRVVEFQIKVGLKGAVPARLVAGKRGVLQGAGSVQTGDAGFDKRIWMDGADPQAALAYLSPARKDALREVARLNAVVLGANQENPAALAHTQPGYKPTLEWLEALLKDYLAVAERLDGD